MYGHALDLLPRCPCGKPALIVQEDGSLICARCELTQAQEAQPVGS